MSKNYGTLISSPIRPLSSSMSIPTAYSNEILGGFHSVSTTTERNSIPGERRQFGMLVYITNDNDFYQLKQISSSDVSDNLNWDLINISGVATTTEWLDSVISRESTPPATPSLSDRYLVTVGTSSWFGLDDYIVEWDGSIWIPTLPTEGTTLRVNNEIDGLYGYLNTGVAPQWIKQEFVSDPQYPKFDIGVTDTMNISTGSQYLIYGDFNVDGVVNNWGKTVIINGTVSGTGSINLNGSGTLQQVELLTDVLVGTGLTVSSPSIHTRLISSNLLPGSGITFSYGSASELTISSIPLDIPGGRPKYLIQAGETVSVPNYEEYYIYGDLEVQGVLDIATYGKVVVTNGNLIAASGSTINNIGNVEVYDLLTVADDNLKVDISEIKYGKEGRILFESELKYVPILGTSARVVTESDDLVYATSSAYSTSTVSTSFDRYLGISTNDPLKKLHINGSGILIDGTESEQDQSLGDSNWARFVIDTSTSNTNTLMDLRNDQGKVLWVDGDISGGFRFPSVSIGKTPSNTIFNVSDYYGNDYFSIGATGPITAGTNIILSDLGNFSSKIVDEFGENWFRFVDRPGATFLEINAGSSSNERSYIIGTKDELQLTSLLDTGIAQYSEISLTPNSLQIETSTQGDPVIIQREYYERRLITTTNSTPVDIFTFSFDSGSIKYFEADLTAVNLLRTESSYDGFFSVIRRDIGGTLHQVSSVDQNTKSEFTTASASFGFTGSVVYLKVSGESGTTINWNLNIKYR